LISGLSVTLKKAQTRRPGGNFLGKYKRTGTSDEGTMETAVFGGKRNSRSTMNDTAGVTHFYCPSWSPEGGEKRTCWGGSTNSGDRGEGFPGEKKKT